MAKEGKEDNVTARVRCEVKAIHQDGSIPIALSNRKRSQTATFRVPRHLVQIHSLGGGINGTLRVQVLKTLEDELLVLVPTTDCLQPRFFVSMDQVVQEPS